MSTTLHFHAVAPHPKVAPALRTQVTAALSPFRRYLDQAIASAKRRQIRYRLPWEKVRDLHILGLEPLETAILLARPKPGWRITNWPRDKEPDATQPLMVVAPRAVVMPVEELRFDQGQPVVVPGEELKDGDQVYWCGVPVEVVREDAVPPPARIEDQKGNALEVVTVAEDGDRWRIVVRGRPSDGPLIVDGVEREVDPEPPLKGVTRLWSDQRDEFWVSGGLLKVEKLPGQKHLKGDNGLHYRWYRRETKSRAGVWIQLLPPEETHSDDLIDPRAAFLSEEVQEVWTSERPHKANVIRVRRVDRENYQLNVAQLPKEKYLYLPVNTRSLKLQRRAIDQLMKSPLPHHQGLLRLCEDPDRVRWPAPESVSVNQWFVLTDTSIDGTREQQEFVHKALGTKDFALLEGPPGSGKTTAICELVLQLVSRHKRVLLCGSTHVAIDNVIERLANRSDVSMDIVRIGKLDRVDERVQATQVDRRVEDLVARWRDLPALSGLDDDALHDAAERTILTAADLTCGTTMGIINHAFFDRKGMKDEPITRVPVWDVLIVDEASKTRIPEFLVPAVMARKWVIVGDVRQLPPFAERTEIAANLGALADGNGTLLCSEEEQRALLIVHRLTRPPLRNPSKRWLIVEPEDVLLKVEQVLEERTFKSGEGPQVVHVVDRGGSRGRSRRLSLKAIQVRRQTSLQLLLADWVLVSVELFPKVAPFLPGDLLLASSPQELDKGRDHCPFFYRQAHWFSHHRDLERSIRERGREVRTVDALEENERAWLNRHTWADEVCWRLTRIHELRRTKRDRERRRYRRDIQNLLPGAADEGGVEATSRRKQIEKAVGTVQAIGLPSILEVIQDGVGDAWAKRPTGLTSGFKGNNGSRTEVEHAFDARFHAITYQHRMHPDISQFPREVVYRGTALRDANTLQRRDEALGWDFLSHAPSRRIWVPVSGREQGGVNRDEIRVMREFVAQMMAWAERKGEPDRDPKVWEMACLSFYVKQELAIRDMLQKLTGNPRSQTRFHCPNLEITCGTVDRFQGREADVVLLSMRNTRRVGFLDSLNRLNVATTRARQLLVLIGKRRYFQECGIYELQELAKSAQVWRPHGTRGGPRSTAGRTGRVPRRPKFA